MGLSLVEGKLLTAATCIQIIVAARHDIRVVEIGGQIVIAILVMNRQLVNR